MSGVIVDSSVWVDFFAGREIPALEEALQQGIVVLSPIVVAELVSGAHQKRQRAAIEDLLAEFPLHDATLAHWIRVGELRQAMRSKGFAVSISDAHVAQCALDRDALLLSRDSIFTKIARYCPLRLRSD